MSLNKPIKITFVLPTLSAGGSERIFSFLAQNIDKTQFETTLLIIGKSSEAVYDVQGTTVLFLEKSRVLNGITSIYKFIKKTNPDIVLSVISHLNTVMAYLSLFFPKTKFIARESTVLSVDAAFFNRSKSISLSNLLIKKRFNYFDKIICQSQDMLDDITKNFDVEEKKMVVINNPITELFEIKKDSPSDSLLSLVTVARLSKEKGISRIIKILSQLKVPFHYTLIGAGSEKESIISLIEKHGLSEKVTHVSFTTEVSEYLKKNHMFLQGSYVEGFPNALLESCAVGTPVIAFNVPGGTKEIVVNGVNGYLVDDEESFLLKLEENKIWNSQDVRNSVLEKFNKEKIISEYEALFLNLQKQASKSK